MCTIPSPHKTRPSTGLWMLLALIILAPFAEVEVTVDWATAKSIFVDNDPQAGMQAFMQGKVKVQGDMTKLMAMQQGGMAMGGGEVPTR